MQQQDLETLTDKLGTLKQSLHLLHTLFDSAHESIPITPQMITAHLEMLTDHVESIEDAIPAK